MGRNVEIKVRLTSEQFENVKRRAASCANNGSDVLRQRDTFFKSAIGRLKLREFLCASGDTQQSAELIFYHRPDVSGPKVSDYSLIQTNQPAALKSALEQANGILGIVEKTRYLYLVGQTRIHLDEVRNLGTYAELEVVLGDKQTEQDGSTIANQLMIDLAIPTESLVDVAYIDILLSQP